MIGGSVKAQQKMMRDLYRTYRKSVGWSSALLLTSLAFDVHQDDVKTALGWDLREVIPVEERLGTS